MTSDQNTRLTVVASFGTMSASAMATSALTSAIPIPHSADASQSQSTKLSPALLRQRRPGCRRISNATSTLQATGDTGPA